MDKFGLLDKIILDLNRLADATGVERCALLVGIVQTAGALKDNLKESDRAAAEREALLVKQLEELTATPEPEEKTQRIGGNTVMFGFGGDAD